VEFEYDRLALVNAITGTVTKHFVGLTSKQTSAPELRAALREAATAAAKATALLMPGIDVHTSSMEVIREMVQSIEEQAEPLIAKVMRPDSDAFRSSAND
jgi:hypothetical protein